MKTKLAALAGVIIGIALLLLGGGGAPTWLCNLQAALFCAFSLIYGFTAFTPSAPAWMSSRPAIGIASIYMGVAVMLVPANIVTSSFFIGIGIRLLMAEMPQRAEAAARAPGLSGRNGDIVLRESGKIVTRD